MRLLDLDPRYLAPSEGAPDRVIFACPLCRKGVVSVWLREGEFDPERRLHGCNAIPPEFETLTITPSVDDQGKCTAARRNDCPGWHGHIQNGEIVGGL